MCINYISGTRILNIVVIKLIAPNNEETPAKCKLKIAKSTEAPEMSLEYSIKVDKQSNLFQHLLLLMQKLINKNKEGGNNQKLIYYLIVEMPYLEHLSLKEQTNYQNHLLITGITIKKIIIKA